MHDAVIVGALQGITHGRDDAEGFFRREPLRLEKLAEIHAIHELHEQEVKATRLPEVIHADDVRVIQRCERMSFLFKPCGELRVIRALWCEQFQRDQAAAAEALGLSAAAMKVTVHRMRYRFRQMVKEEIAGTLKDAAAVEDEMRSLLIALGG